MRDGGDNPSPNGSEPADLAEVALGVTREQLDAYTVVIERFLRGEYFSLDEEGKVASWHAAAEARFGWTVMELAGEDFFDFVASRETGEELRTELTPLLVGEKQDGPAGRSLEIETQRRDGGRIRTDVAAIPIRVGDGYSLNKVLKDIMTHRGNPVELTRMKKRHAEVLRLLVTALDGGDLPDPLGDDGWQPGGGRIEQRWQPAGALIVFDGSPAEGIDAGDGEGGESPAGEPLFQGGAHELERMRDENHELRMKVREAEREAERLRDELEDVRANGVGGRARRVAEHSDPSISPEHIKKALREDRFTLHCQPVLDLRSDLIAQHELLLRMVGGDGELIMPQAFLGTARRAGLLRGIDQWVVRRAIRTIGEQAQVGRDVCLEVNLSSESLHDSSLVPIIERELATTGIDPDRLVLEITEQVAIADQEGARSLAKHLRAIGCGFALDDFGTSFGSFRFLKDMPVDYLKLDGDLIVTLSESRTAQLVVKALVDVARGTGAETIAVFASDDDTLRLLRELGVGYAQGHKVGRPRPIAEALSAVESQGLRPVEPVAMSEAQPAASGTRKRAK
ncbi:MAG: hypothetical protein QOK25_984 [Thermoleophilaceae bacterium]|nr:hypothetical protein [Thermoleophilaceae bacterium]